MIPLTQPSIDSTKIAKTTLADHHLLIFPGSHIKKGIHSMLMSMRTLFDRIIPTEISLITFPFMASPSRASRDLQHSRVSFGLLHSPRHGCNHVHYPIPRHDTTIHSFLTLTLTLAFIPTCSFTFDKLLKKVLIFQVKGLQIKRAQPHGVLTRYLIII